MSKMDRELEILGLEPSASASDVQDAFDDLLTVWDPDEFQNNPRLHSRAKKQMKEIHVAYGTLFGNKCPGCGTSNFYSANTCVVCHQRFGLIDGLKDEPIELAPNLEMSSSEEEPTRLYTSPSERTDQEMDELMARSEESSKRMTTNMMRFCVAMGILWFLAAIGVLDWPWILGEADWIFGERHRYE